MQLNFDKLNGLVPAVVQDAQTKNMLMVGFMNQEAYQKTCTEKKVTFFSRSKNRLWTKGETSGNFLHVIDMQIDCDEDTLLILAIPQGEVCHRGNDTCFSTAKNEANVFFLDYLANIIKERDAANDEKSYTVSLLRKGVHKVAQKVGEEAVEVVIDAMRGDKERFKEECADLLYHLLVLLHNQETSLNEVMNVLKKRHSK